MEDFNLDFVTCSTENVIETKKFEKQEDVIDVKFQIENKWEGIVVDIDENTVYSKLKETQSGDDYEYNFKIEDVPSDDRNLIAEGALFNFYSGYQINGGTRKNSKVIKFRRQLNTNKTIDVILDKMKAMGIADLIEKH